MNNSTYEEVLDSYTSQLRGLFVRPAAPQAETLVRGGGAVDIDILAERTEALTGVSRQLGEMTSDYLSAPETSVRQAAELKLLAQANAELQVALALFAATEEEASPPEAGALRAGGVLGDAALAVNDLATVLQQPLDRGLEPFIAGGAVRGQHPTDLEKARSALLAAATDSLDAIVYHSSKTSSLAFDALFKLDGKLISKAVAPASKEIAELVDSAVNSLNKKIRELLKNAVRFMLQAYDWVLALIGKDQEQSARKKVQEWIVELRASHQNPSDTPDLANALVRNIYLVGQVQPEVTGWITASQVGVEVFNQAADAVSDLGSGFEVKTQSVQKFLKALGAVPKVIATATAALSLAFPAAGASVASAMPAIEVVRAGITMGLLGYTVYAGYDHVDSGAINFFNKWQITIPDRVSGVRETVQQTLGVVG